MQIARRIEKKAEKLGYNVVFSSTGESPQRESKIIQSMLDSEVMKYYDFKTENNFKQHIDYQNIDYDIKKAIHTLTHTAKVDGVLFDDTFYQKVLPAFELL